MLEFASHGLFGSEVGNQTKKTGGSLVSPGALVAGLTQVCMQEAGVLGLKIIRAHMEGRRHLYRCLSIVHRALNNPEARAMSKMAH